MNLLCISPALLCCLLKYGVYGESLSAVEGDSVTLHTGVETNQQEKIRWYYEDTRIAQISGDQSRSCTDVQCNEGNERFRDRLKLDQQTGSLTIMNTRTTDSGLYIEKISSSSSIYEKIFNVTIHGVSAAEGNETKTKSVKEGESVTLDPGEINNPNNLLIWFFKNILIADITGDPSKTCTDNQCTERFRNRLKVNHQTGSLTITNTRTTDSGEYHLQINSSRISIIRGFSVSVSDLGPPSTAAAGTISAAVVVVVCVFVLVMAARVIFKRCRKTESPPTGQNGAVEQCNGHQQNSEEDLPLEQTETASKRKKRKQKRKWRNNT
ncbi:uncharacterized protein LOC127158176 [Labeo rohita]|uniref:uncharacterized protein LOC127158176 n=1 Tax=Labeo rohita TaxID=84645 RepID=UPI0021E2CA76|nr:uncharacterized protein LOC127158176 [Labeo rohita]